MRGAGWSCWVVFVAVVVACGMWHAPSGKQWQLASKGQMGALGCVLSVLVNECNCSDFPSLSLLLLLSFSLSALLLLIIHFIYLFLHRSVFGAIYLLTKFNCANKFRLKLCFIV